MSRTWVHAPYGVQLKRANNPHARRHPLDVVARHDHSTGPCDLPASPDVDNWTTVTRCYWDSQFNGRNQFCGCPMCTDRPGRRAARRRARHEATRELRRFQSDPVSRWAGSAAL